MNEPKIHQCECENYISVNAKTVKRKATNQAKDYITT
jgi:hypothetical protein